MFVMSEFMMLVVYVVFVISVVFMMLLVHVVLVTSEVFIIVQNACDV